ncbi:MAG: hypothetical protein ACKOC5_04560 [Chloroflexota bacterium]
MLTPATVTLAFALILLLLALFKPQAGRIVFGVFFLIMAWGVNLPVLLSDPLLFAAAGENALLPLYAWFFQTLLPAAPVFFAGLLIALETTIGLLTLSRGRAAQAGLLLGALFCLGITFVGPEEIWMPSVAIAPLLLARRSWPAAGGSAGR